MKLFFDTEFTGLHKNTTLISLGIVNEDGKKFYAEFSDFNREQCNEWINENVIKHCYLPWLMAKGNILDTIDEWKKNGYEVADLPMTGQSIGAHYFTAKTTENITEVCGDKAWVSKHLKDWLSQLSSVEFVSDVCHYDFVLLIDIFGCAFDLPDNVCPACHDINQDIANFYGISEKEAFDKSREDIVQNSIGGKKHNALYDAEAIKAIYDKIHQ